MKDVTYADYMHAKIVCKDFEIENLDEYHDLYHMLINPSRSLRGRGSGRGWWYPTLSGQYFEVI